MSLQRLLAVVFVFAVALGLSIYNSPAVKAGDVFQPVAPDELKMTSEPGAPGAPAIILFRQVDRDDTGVASRENNYVRIKVLTENGRKYADVEIPFIKESGSAIANLKARTIRPDGSIANFEGKPFEKTVVKAKGLKVMVKTFTLPDVQVGSIIEYYYTEILPEHALFNTHWILSDDLFTRRAKFSLKPYTSSYAPIGVRWTWNMLPAGSTEPAAGPDRVVRMEAINIPAFQTEDYMPPENELKARVDFIYSDEPMGNDADKFWKKKGRNLNDELESFIGKRKAMEAAVAQIVSPDDPPEVKARKIYARVQQIRNTSYEVRKSEQEKKRDKEKTASNVEEIWKRGYANGNQLTWLYLALARAAGLEAYGVWASERRNYFFSPSNMDPGKLDANLVLVKINGKDVFCDPGAAFTPYGMLMWPETGVQGLRLDKDGGSWIQTAVPESSASRVERRATLALSETGDLEGKITITFTGLEGMKLRVEERNEDDAARKKFLEDQAREYIPVAGEVVLTNKPDWSSSSTPLVAEYNLKITGWASGVGRRMLFPVGLFSGAEKHVFDHSERVHPIYFEFPSEKEDDVTVSLPSGWKVSNAPPEENESQKIFSYVSKVETGKGVIHLTRKLRLDLLLIDARYYPALRSFFQAVRKGDEQQIVLQPGAPSGAGGQTGGE